MIHFKKEKWDFALTLFRNEKSLYFFSFFLFWLILYYIYYIYYIRFLCGMRLKSKYFVLFLCIGREIQMGWDSMCSVIHVLYSQAFGLKRLIFLCDEGLSVNIYLFLFINRFYWFIPCFFLSLGGETDKFYVTFLTPFSNIIY